MLTSSSSSSSYSSQYLQPEYFRSPSPTAESKPSPLTLLAQTCNSIGRDSTTTKSKSTEEAKSGSSGRSHDSPSDSGRTSPARDQLLHTDVDVKDVPSATTRLPSSPAEPVKSRAQSSPSTAGSSRAVSTDGGRRRVRTPSPAKTTPPPGSPSRYRCADGKAAGEYSSATMLQPSSDPDGLYAMQYLAAVAALQRQSAACDAGLMSYLAAAHHHRLPLNPFSGPAGFPISASSNADRAASLFGSSVLSPAVDPLKPGSCSDPCCCRCLQLSAVAAAASSSSRGASCVGCSQYGSHPPPSTSASTVAPAGSHGAFAAALSALSRLPAPPPAADSTAAGSTSVGGGPSTLHTCNWLHPGGTYCGLRFASADDLMQHLHSHCSSSTTPPEFANSPFPPDLHPVAAGSLFAPLAVLYGAPSSTTVNAGLHYTQALPPMDFIPPGLPQPPAAVQLPSTTKSMSPSSLLRQQQHHGLAVAAAAAAARYHPYRVPPSAVPLSAVPAAYPSSLAAYYGALCGMAPGSNGTVPPVRL